ncbi:hypothetical protein [Streptomyces sp. NPDC052496]|uniref:hypothetical protein n=1 Tax=Streptomyces sp. NPDC052496 TaxID=3154951 RepID=UPI00343F63F7
MSDVATWREQRRLDAAAAEERRAARQRAEDERAARLRDQARTDRDADRAARLRRRAERAGRRAAALTPEHVYRRGTLALVVASGLASLPAQVLHFVGVSPLLLPLPLALEGAAWVMAAGVAYADQRELAGWVRWLLRGLVVACAGFAAWVNYGYGTGLAGHGLSAADAATVGAGLAAVTLLGPAVFEIRQWVSTLSVAAGDQEARRERWHARRRRWHHREVCKVADRLLSAAPIDHLTPDDAWDRAWSIVHGADAPGMTPDLHRQAVQSADRMRQAQTPAPTAEVPDPGPAPALEAKPQKTTSSTVKRSTGELEQSTGPAPVSVDVGSTAPAPDPTPVVVRPVAVVAAASARPRRATGRVPQSARSAPPKRTAEQLLIEARAATEGWPIEELTAEAIRRAVHCAPAKARVLRETLQAERAASERAVS